MPSAKAEESDLVLSELSDCMQSTRLENSDSEQNLSMTSNGSVQDLEEEGAEFQCDQMPEEVEEEVEIPHYVEDEFEKELGYQCHFCFAPFASMKELIQHLVVSKCESKV